MLSRLTHRARIALRQFLASWINPSPKAPRLPRDVAKAMEAERQALARNACREIGAARRRLRQARHEGLRFERANGQFPKGMVS